MPKRKPDLEGTDFPDEISAPAARALTGAGYSKVEQLAKTTEAELLELHGMGPKAIKSLRAALEAKGLSFAE
jgi:predicted Fe-Mo cluster-binding NifX family protein